MYSEEVQDFIQRHIDLIDKEDWDQLLRLTMGPNELDFLSGLQGILEEIEGELNECVK